MILRSNHEITMIEMIFRSNHEITMIEMEHQKEINSCTFICGYNESECTDSVPGDGK